MALRRCIESRQADGQTIRTEPSSSVDRGAVRLSRLPVLSLRQSAAPRNVTGHCDGIQFRPGQYVIAPEFLARWAHLGVSVIPDQSLRSRKFFPVETVHARNPLSSYSRMRVDVVHSRLVPTMTGR